MNKERRKTISNIIIHLESSKSDIENLLTEEQESLDALPENMQEGERANAISEAITALEEAADTLDNVISTLGDI